MGRHRVPNYLRGFFVVEMLGPAQSGPVVFLIPYGEIRGSSEEQAEEFQIVSGNRLVQRGADAAYREFIDNRWLRPCISEIRFRSTPTIGRTARARSARLPGSGALTPTRAMEILSTS